MVIVTFHTNGYYEEWAQKLRASASSRGYRFQSFAVRDKGNYQLNTFQKVDVIREALDLFPGEAVLYVDADAEIAGSLALLADLEEDVAVAVWGPPGVEETLFGGTIFFRNNSRVRELLGRWARVNETFYTETDQDNLRAVLATMKERGEIAVRRLPPEWCWLEEPMRPWLPDAEPVVFHYGVSRSRWMR